MLVKATTSAVFSWAAGGPDEKQGRGNAKSHAEQIYTHKYFII
jgi:hypothetical protein